MLECFTLHVKAFFPQVGYLHLKLAYLCSEVMSSEHEDNPRSVSDIVVFIVSTWEWIVAILLATSVFTACSLDSTASNSSASTAFRSDLSGTVISFFNEVRISAFRSAVSIWSSGCGESPLFSADKTLELAVLGPEVEILL